MHTIVFLDLLSIDTASNVSAVYSDMIDKLQTQFNVMLVAIGLIVAAILGATWWWNYKGAKQQIAEESEKNKLVFQRLFKTSTSKMEEYLKSQIIEEAKKVSANIHGELDEYKKSITEAVSLQQAELNRVFALHCDSTKSFFIAAAWWYSAANLYHQTGNDRFAQISLDAGLVSLKQAVDSEITLEEDDNEKLDAIISNVDTLPDSFSSQKSETKKHVKKLRAGIK